MGRPAPGQRKLAPRPTSISPSSELEAAALFVVQMGHAPSHTIDPIRDHLERRPPQISFSRPTQHTERLSTPGATDRSVQALPDCSSDFVRLASHFHTGFDLALVDISRNLEVAVFSPARHVYNNLVAGSQTGQMGTAVRGGTVVDQVVPHEFATSQ